MYTAYAIQSTENKRVQWYKEKEKNAKQLLRIKARTEHLLGRNPRSFAVVVESLYMHKHFKENMSPDIFVAACQSSTTNITCMYSTKKFLKIHTGLTFDCHQNYMIRVSYGGRGAGISPHPRNLEIEYVLSQVLNNNLGGAWVRGYAIVCVSVCL